ncbi:MAG: HigA family addiction module antitoxin [Acidobacteriota bacterium]
MTKRHLPPTHPGEILQEELTERGISISQFSRDTRLPISRARLMMKRQRPVTSDVALRLERYLGASAQFWMNLQIAYDLATAKQDFGERIIHEVSPAA